MFDSINNSGDKCPPCNKIMDWPLLISMLGMPHEMLNEHKQSLEEEVLSWSILDMLSKKSPPFKVMISLSQQARFLF